MTVLLAGLGVLPAGAAGIIAVTARVWTTVSELAALGAVAGGGSDTAESQPEPPGIAQA
jgi:hypothetical protein